MYNKQMRGGKINHLSMAYSVRSICTKDYWNQKLLLNYQLATSLKAMSCQGRVTRWWWWTSLTATVTHVPYGITQCYLPPGRGDIPIKAGTWFSDPRRMQGWADLVGLVTEQTVVLIVIHFKIETITIVQRRSTGGGRVHGAHVVFFMYVMYFISRAYHTSRRASCEQSSNAASADHFAVSIYTPPTQSALPWQW